MVSAPLPLLVRVTVCDALLPTFTLLNASDDGLIDSCDCVVVAEPLRLMLSGEPGALLATDTLPPAALAAVGANLTVNEVVAPGFSVPAVKLVTENPAPEAVAEDTETFPVPLFVSVTVLDPLLPTRTVPKLMLAGFAESPPWVPVPLNAIESVGFEAFVEMVTAPDALPEAVGAKAAVKDTCAPAAIVCPAVSPLMLKPAPEALAWLIVTVLAPEFESVIVSLLLVPTVTPLKL